MRDRASSVVANPILVGAVTTLIIVVAVFLSYNANNGLPFVPTTKLNALTTNGSEVVKGDEVRVGGHRVGTVSQMVPLRLHSGKVVAELQLKLDKSVGKVPVDSKVVLRPRAPLSLKYVELDLGHSRKSIPSGGTLPLSHTEVPVDLDQFYDMFDKPTRVSSSRNLVGYGNTLGGRGLAINDFLNQAPRLFGLLQPVMSNLAAPQTQLARFFQAVDRTVRTVAPVSQTYAHGFTTQANTFRAIDNSPPALKATISKSPPTESVSTTSLRIQRPFLFDSAAFGKDLSRAAAELPSTLPVLNSALRIGIPVSRRSVSMDQELRDALDSLDRLARTPTTNGSLRGLTATVGTLQPTLRYLGPYVTTCNYWNYFWTLLAEHISHVVPTGTAQRVLANTQGQQKDSVGATGAILPAAGRNVTQGTPQYVHIAGYARAITDDGRADCEAGQQGYIDGANPFTTLQDPHYQHVVYDPPHGPAQEPGKGEVIVGPTYGKLDAGGKGVGLNPARVPAGETFTAVPGGTSPQIAKQP